MDAAAASERFPAEAGVRLSWRERRALARCARALARGRRVSGHPVASGAHGLLVDVGGAVGHVPAAEAAAPQATTGRRRWRAGGWEGWVAAIDRDLVHLSAQPPESRAADAPVRTGRVLSTSPSGAVVLLDEDGERSDGRASEGADDDASARALLPWDEVRCEPPLTDPPLGPGDRVAGRVIGLTLDGPVLSERAVVPSPWPAVALAFPAGTRVQACVEEVAGDRARVRIHRPPRASGSVRLDALPAGAGPGAPVEATVMRVDTMRGAVLLDEITPRAARAPRRGRAARRPEPSGPSPAEAGSRS